jgi:zeaxanthin glucosyltransferase
MKIGVISVPLSGHLNPMTALARKFRSRGHNVVFLGFPDAERAVRAAGLDFISYGEEEYPVGATPAAYAHLATLTGDDITRYSCQEVYPRRCKSALEHLPRKLSAAGIEALVIDKAHHYVELLPLSMGIPYVQVWNTLHYDGSGVTPPFNFNWPHQTTPEAMARNLEAVRKLDAAFIPTVEIAKAWAKKNHLEIDWNAPGPTASRFAVLTQSPKEFDFEDCPQPGAFYYTGPFQDHSGREAVPFPWEQLTGEPLVYASMGTLVNGLHYVYHAILEAIERLPGVQLVLSVGRNLRIAELGRIPSNAIVVPFAPQIELLNRASLCITHAGMNTTMESLAAGCPMVAVPVGFDQPGIATRIKYHGLGESLPVETLTVDNLSEAMQRVLRDPSYRNKARYFQEVIAKTRGLDLAADIVERVCQRSARPELSPIDR